MIFARFLGTSTLWRPSLSVLHEAAFVLSSFSTVSYESLFPNLFPESLALRTSPRSANPEREPLASLVLSLLPYLPLSLPERRVSSLFVIRATMVDASQHCLASISIV